MFFEGNKESGKAFCTGALGGHPSEYKNIRIGGLCQKEAGAHLSIFYFEKFFDIFAEGLPKGGKAGLIHPVNFASNKRTNQNT